MDKERLFNSGVLVEHGPGAVLPSQDEWEQKKGGFAVIECPKRIPCNPCSTSCPVKAVKPFSDINDRPSIDYSKCTGCGLCVARCPGLACFVIDLTYGKEDEALIKLPYEMLPLPVKGQTVACLDREGKKVAQGLVVDVKEPWKDKTQVVSVAIPRNLVDVIRGMEVEAE
jgi:Fe-S-cluster-containing hydrogenase component 2